jgi:hypothetical protein
VLKHIEPENPGHHHRCYSNKATDRYILGGRRGTEFIDLARGDVLWNSWARGVCMYGVMPANGLVYVPPHACGCYATTKLRGFNALAAEPQSLRPGVAQSERPDGGRLQRGPAFDEALAARPAALDPRDAWPTYRHDADHIYLRQMVFSKTGEHQEQGAPHLLTVSDFLDATWPHRSDWIFGTHTSLATGCSSREKKLRYGRLLAFSPSTLYGYGRKTVHWSNQLQDGPYRIFAVSRSSGSLLWEKGVPVEVRAMVVTDKTLFVAGPPATLLTSWQPPDEDKGAMLLAFSTSDGAEQGRCQLDSPPILDGMAAAAGRLYLTTTTGKVICF